ncbi:MAG: hypothetical protein HY272_11330 [Gammaproteobacteria bacterium]|nr:hypothetical protein [Gammaproteobacteria bacterium]
MPVRSIHRRLLALLLAVPALTQAAVAPPKEDIHFLLEHLAEAAQDARYFALPWPAASGQEWQPVIAVAATEFDTNVAKMQGLLLTAGAARQLNERWSYELIGFYDQFNVGGNATEQVLTAGQLQNVPLDIPEQAEFSSQGGTVRHSGVGAVFRRELQSANSAWRWAGTGGLLLERLELADYQVRYRLLAGANAGTAGVLDYSGTHNFISPFIGLQGERALNSRWTVVPRAAIGAPVPAGKFDPRLTGPGFDLTPESTGSGHGKIGDVYLMLGMGVRDQRSGMEIDLGSMATFPLIERLTHNGVDQGMFIALTWRGSGDAKVKNKE